MIRADLLEALERIRRPGQKPVLEILDAAQAAPDPRKIEILRPSRRASGNAGPGWWNRYE